MPTTRDQGVIRASGTRSVLEKTNRLLGWDGRVKVLRPKSGSENDPPGWTDGKVITINGDYGAICEALVKGFTPRTLMMVTGLNYHELAHCFFTPRLDSGLVTKIRDEGYFESLNCLEDQAIETKFVRLYRPARHYFTAVIAQLMMESGQRETTLKVNHPLIYGRKFLPAEIRQRYKDNFIRPDLIPRFERIIDDYIACVYPDDEDEMFRLVKEYHDLSQELPQFLKPLTYHSIYLDSGNGIEGLSGGTMIDKNIRVEVAKQGEGEGHDESKGRDGDSNKDGKPSGLKAGQFEGKAEKHAPLSDLLEDAIDDSQQEVSEELERRDRAIQHSAGHYEIDAMESQYDVRSPEALHYATSRQVRRALMRISQKFKPGWHTRQDTGKVNVNDLSRIKRGNIDVFKRFSPGVTNALDFEVVLLLDQSGSMHGHIKQSSEALWILHHAMKSVGSEITALGYSNMQICQVLMQRRTPTPKMIHDYWTGGSTFVMPALHETDRIFRVSNKRMKLCVIVTDGQFSDVQDVANWLRANRYPTAIVGINADVSQTWKVEEYHSLKVSQTIKNPMDLIPLVQRFAVAIANERYTSR